MLKYPQCDTNIGELTTHYDLGDSMQPDLQVLIVEDDVMYREYTILALQRAFLNIHIKEADSVDSALALLLKEKFDCVLLDFLLPDGSATDLLTQLSQYQRHCPVILLTGLDDDQIGLNALQAGAEDYLVKGETTPFSLKRSIRHAVERFARRTEFEDLVSKLHETNTALKNANEKLAELVVTDSLTGIPNRRAFQDRLTQLVFEGRRGRHFALIMADIDHFKKFNDTYGHQIGDQILTTVAQTLSTTARETDFVARYGGEEFCILLTDIDEDLAIRQAERLRRSIHSISKYGITMSFGISVASNILNTGDLLIRAADAALYHAKNNGRDRIESFNSIQTDPEVIQSMAKSQ